MTYRIRKAGDCWEVVTASGELVRSGLTWSEAHRLAERLRGY